MCILFEKLEKLTIKVRFNKDTADKALTREVESIRKDTKVSTANIDDKYKNEVGRIKDKFTFNDHDMKNEKKRTDNLNDGLANVKEKMELASAA